MRILIICITYSICSININRVILEYLNLQLIISRSSNWISINRLPFDSSYREESNDMYNISVALILTELFRFEFYNKNLTLFTLILTLFQPLGGPGPDYFDPGVYFRFYV